MKLRFGKNSVRLRVLRSEVDALRTGARLQETLHFGPDEATQLTYSLGSGTEASEITVAFTGNEIAICIPSKRLGQWASSEEVGIYDRIATGPDWSIDVIVEKDFACLDRSDAENADTYENPNASC